MDTVYLISLIVGTLSWCGLIMVLFGISLFGVEIKFAQRIENSNQGGEKEFALISLRERDKAPNFIFFCKNMIKGFVFLVLVFVALILVGGYALSMFTPIKELGEYLIKM